jgi:fatty-acyl-CoA synthase
MLTPDRVALRDASDGLRPITYRQWNESANQTAHWLHELGILPGDRVAVLAVNSIDYLDLWFACGKLGAILQTLNVRLTPRELAVLIQDGTPRLLVYGPEFTEQVQGIRSWFTVPIRAAALDANTRADSADHAWKDREHSSSTRFPSPELSENDPWVLCYTGGTTGLPKGAVLTHGTIFWNAVNTVMSWGLRPDDVAPLNAPMFHTGGLNVFTAPLVMIGGSSIVCRGFDVDQVYDLVHARQITLLFGVPTMFHSIVHHPRWSETDFSHLRLIISGGAACPLPLFHAFFERGVAFRTGYGLTEAGPNTFWLPEHLVRIKPGAVGYPLWQVQVRVTGAEDRTCAPGEIGELMVRGPHVIPYYWNRPEESANMFAQGWLRTGDLARCDADGCHWIVGRIKDVIISGGENIYPAELEAELAGHPGVGEAAVIGLPDPRWGESPHAWVVPRSGHRIETDQLMEFLADRVARFKLPRTIRIVESLPRTAAGKIDKKQLRDSASSVA